MAYKRTVTGDRPAGGAGGAGGISPGGGPKQQERREADSTLQDRIRERAYEHYLRRGGGPGDAVADWCRAEREILDDRGA